MSFFRVKSFDLSRVSLQSCLLKRKSAYYTLLGCLCWGVRRVRICGKVASRGFAQHRWLRGLVSQIGFAAFHIHFKLAFTNWLHLCESKSLRQRLRESSPHIMYHTNAFANIWFANHVNHVYKFNYSLAHWWYFKSWNSEQP